MKNSVLFVSLILLIVFASVLGGILAHTIVYDGYDEFCKERDLSFDSNYGEPICYKITNGKIDFVFIGKLNGEIYLR